MKLIYNKIIPFQGFKYINIGGLIFTRSKRLADKNNWNPIDYNHEAIHTKLWKELLYVFYPIAYFLAWIFAGFNYKKNAFEKEAYKNQDNLNYLKTRKFLAWI